MKHRVGFNRLGRKPAHRKALHRNMVTSLFKHERIRTTKAKAREIRRTAEKMITRAKVDSVHNRRMVGRDIKDEGILAKLFVEIAPRYLTRPGGYTRMLKIGPRRGDASEMVLLELVEEEMSSGTSEKDSGKKKKTKSAAKPKAEKQGDSKKAEAAKAQPAEEPVEEAAAETPAEPEASDAVVAEGDADESTSDSADTEEE